MQDGMQQAFEEDRAAQAFTANMAAGTGLSLATGAAAWFMRTGAIFASLMSVLPAWKSVDPLAILTANENANKADRKKTDDKDGSKPEPADSADELFNQNNSDKLS